MTCPWCARELVEVDNPLRREMRHRRGEEVACPGPPDDYDQAVADLAAALAEEAGLLDTIASLTRQRNDWRHQALEAEGQVP